eukprot:scaffold1175_cov140-Skeletonema_dohrnii-CCMP3373.AAC.1
MRCVVEESFDVIYLESSCRMGEASSFTHILRQHASIWYSKQLHMRKKDEGMSLIWREMRERHVADNT